MSRSLSTRYEHNEIMSSRRSLKVSMIENCTHTIFKAHCREKSQKSPVEQVQSRVTSARKLTAVGCFVCFGFFFATLANGI